MALDCLTMNPNDFRSERDRWMKTKVLEYEEPTSRKSSNQAEYIILYKLKWEKGPL